MASNLPKALDNDKARRDFARSAFEEHRGAAYAIVLKLLNDTSLAEDIVQETFLQVYRYADQFRGECSLKGWVLTIAVNLSRRMIVRERAQLRVTMLEPAAAGLPSERLQAQDLRAQVHEALSRLPFEQRAAITLSSMEGLGTRDIAKVLGCKEGTVWSRIFNAKKKLACLLSHVEEEHAS